MRLLAGLILAVTVAACAEPTASIDQSAGPEDADVLAPNATTATIADLVHVKLRNDAAQWTFQKLSVLPRNTKNDFWMATFGTLGLKTTYESRQTSVVKPGESVTVDFQVAGPIKGWKAKLHGAVTFAGPSTVAARAPRELWCGPGTWRKIGPHEYVVEFQISLEQRGNDIVPRCR